MAGLPSQPRRHRSLALVCRQWAELVHSPALLTSLDVTLQPARLLPRLRALVEWLAHRAVGHVRQLRLDLTAAEDQADGALDEEGEQEVTASIATVVTLLAGSLRELSLSTSLSLPPLGSWLVPLAQLASLELVCRREQGKVAVNAPLRFLTVLRSLRLHAPSGSVKLRASLPPLLTSLWMHSFSAQLPPQVGTVWKLKLVGFALWGPASCAALHAVVSGCVCRAATACSCSMPAASTHECCRCHQLRRIPALRIALGIHETPDVPSLR